VDFGNLDYSNDDLAEIKLIMSISNAILNYWFCFFNFLSYLLKEV
jgi:hypothetical protein